MDYLAFRYTKAKYKVPITFGAEKKAVDPAEIERRLTGYRGAIFLSGGLDSSLLAAINKPRMAYVAHFPGFEFDELHWARKAADYLNIPLRVVTITRERYLSTVEYLIRQKGDGLHPNEPCLYLLAREAKKDGFRSVMLGTGADEVFGGYTDLLRHEKEYMRSKEVFLNRYSYTKNLVMADIKIPFEKWRAWGMYRFLLEVHLPGLVERAQNACWAAQMEPVCPYLENGIPQLMWSAPKRQRSGEGLGKPLLRSLAHSYLPAGIILRLKVGFPTPWPVHKFLQLNKEIGW